MKRLHIIAVLMVMILAASCSKDKGNYNYTLKEQITVTGIESNYTKISELERITIDPTVTSTEKDADFDYLWGIYETNVQGSAPVLDTICKTKAIDYLVKKSAKGWVLVFRARNKKTGYAQYISANVNVVTQFTRGWYVAKDDGTNTDADLFLTPKNILPESKLENVFALTNGKKLAGKAMLFNFFSSYKSAVTGTLGNTRTLFLTTDKDVSAININTFKEIRNLSTLFYESPAVAAPSFAVIGSAANYLMNAGGLHSIYSMSSNTGQFGARKLINDKNTPYNLSRYFMTGAFTDPIFFDELSSSFVSASGTGITMNAVTDAPETQMPANNCNKKMLYMGVKTTYPLAGFAVLQDKTNPSLKILSSIAVDGTVLTIVNDTLQTSAKLYNASRYALLDGDENMMYFVVGNEVWSRNLSNKFEQLQFTVPAGEQVTFIRHRKYSASGLEAPYAYNYVMIGTKIGGNYKVRMFTKTSGNLSGTPTFTLEGTGSVGDVMYMSPSVSEYTYTNTF